MPVNSNTGIHFTSSISTIKKILEEGFWPRLHFEDMAYIFGKGLQGGFEFPMVCFCDIPLHLVGSHMNQYGHYGIGLKKSWASRKGLNPVCYVRQNSYLHTSLNQIKNVVTNALDRKAINTTEGILTFYRLLAITKPYEGRTHALGSKQNYYQEREWRYVPNSLEKRYLATEFSLMSEGATQGERDRKNLFLKKFSLNFRPSDIKYIVVKHELELAEMTRIIDEVKSPLFSTEELSILKTKVICSKYMSEDF